MPQFAYAAIDAQGATVEGKVKAPTVGRARSMLHDKGLHPISINEKKGALELELTKKRLKKKELMHFSRQLAVFFRAGIPIITALETIQDEANDRVLRRTLEDMVERLRNGSTFADAASAHPEAFPPFYIGILRSAELTGNLDQTLDQLADYIDRDLEARRKVSSALFYPAVVMVLSLCTVVILTVYVIPKFKTLFDGLDATLPLPTRMLLGISSLFTTMWYIPATLIGVFVTLVVLGKKTPRGRQVLDKVMLRLPGTGAIVNYSILERFCRILASMVTAGVPLPDALEVTSVATNNHVFRSKLDKARDDMLQGEGLARPLAETELFPGAARQMFRVGEETGTLDEQLRTAAIYFDRELDMRIKRFTAAFEPAVIVFVGLVVGFVAVALVSAMYGVLGQVET